MKHIRRRLSLLLAAVMILSVQAAPAGSAAADAGSLQPGDTLCGFTVNEVYDSSLLNSVIYTLSHPYSGATLVYVENDDPELAFSIGYRTPYVDETDTNHVFEHSILSGSEKYPAKDLFFDLDNTAYNTYVNAHTMSSTTLYPFSSMSEEQLLKMVDVYMSCMVAPTVLTDENIFKREAIRFELDDPEGDITVNGTVFAEDLGYLTDHNFRHIEHLLDAMYPGETASNWIGMANWHYDDLTFEHMVETYERCYHFDNSLIFLYGDLDLARFLQFLDEEYLSKAPVYGTDLSPWADGVTAPGYVEVQKAIPAYQGDTVEHNSLISCVVDLSGATDVQISRYFILASILNQPGSPLYNLRLERGIENPVSAQANISFAKPLLMFTMEYADPEQKDELRALVEDALKQVAAEGIDPAMLEMVMKAEERDAKLLRNSTNVGISVMQSMILQWVHSGDPNFYRSLEQALATLHADGQQLLVRQMALDLLSPRRSALVTSVPTPGLAEAYDEELDRYLQEMKAAMSREELEAMVAETEAFNAWNAEEQHNRDFLISPHDLPLPTAPDWTKERMDGVTVYRGNTALKGVGEYAICFDLSGMSREEMERLVMAGSFRVHMGTVNHSAAEFYRLLGEYVSDLYADLLYPNAGENRRPMYVVSWCSLTEDFEKSLELILELYTGTDFSDTEMLAALTSTSADSWDMSRQDGYAVAERIAPAGAGLRADSEKFRLDVSGQDCYRLFTEDIARLEADPGFAAELAEAYDSASRKATSRGELIFIAAVPEDAGDAIVGTAVRTLNALPEKNGEAADYSLPEVSKNLAVCIEESLMNSCLIGDYMADESFLGSYLPFFYAFNDRYILPAFRFRLGAYGASSVFQWAQGTLKTVVYSDPNVRETVEALRAMPEEIRAMELTQEELDGYILSAYARSNLPQGLLDEVVTAAMYDLLGMDAERTLAVRADVRNAVVAQQAEAVDHIAKVFENSAFCMVGNEALIRADADCFDEVISLRGGE